MSDGLDNPDEILEPFFSYDPDTEVYSIALISNVDRRVVTLRLDQDSILAFHEKLEDFLEGRILSTEAAYRRQRRGGD